MRSYLLVMLATAVVVYLATPLIRALAIRVGAMTDVRQRDVHTTPTPRLGGVAMFLGMLAGLMMAWQIPFLHQVMDKPEVWGVVASGTLVVLVGAIDDIWGLDPLTRLAAQGLAGLILAWQGVQFVSLPVYGVTVGSSDMLLAMTVFGVVVTINAVNFIDGLDGLVAGVMAIAGSAFFVYTYALTREDSPTDYSSLAAALAAVLVGLCLGFLPHNSNPARIFMGDSGAYLVGLLMASTAIVVTGQVDPAAVSATKLMPAFAPILLPTAILLIPMLDLAWAVVRRSLRGESPFAADRGHLHHRLLDLGHSHRSAVWVMYSWAAALSYGAVAVAFWGGMLGWSVSIGGIVLAIAATVSAKLRCDIPARGGDAASGSL